ncbi:hypothetical protein KKG72_06565 [bacterium]|nr:hypothetical protein [bacterium]MBU1994866.1 hypothetical protein [bacterium]
MKKIFLLLFLLFSTISFATDNNQTKEMSKEDVDKWFEEYAELEEKTKKLKKLNNTLDELNGMLEVKKIEATK